MAKHTTRNLKKCDSVGRVDGSHILAARRQVKRIRKVSDTQIFKLAMKTQTLTEFFRYVKGNM